MELDQYESFFRGAFEEAGYGSLWMKRPRPASDDGCAILYRRHKFSKATYSDFYRVNVQGHTDY